MPTGIQCTDTYRVGYVLKRFPRFSETFILNELLELQRQGIAVEVFSLLRPPEEPRHAALGTLHIPVTYLPRGGALKKWTLSTGIEAEDRNEISVTELFSGGDIPFAELMPDKDSVAAAQLCLQATTLAMLVSARGIQHLHAHFASNATTVALLAGRMAGVPYSFTAHARDIYHTYVDEHTDNAARRLKIREARFVATVSEYNRRYLAGLAGEQFEYKVRRLYNGIHLGRFTNSEYDPAGKHLVAVGRLVEKKGFPYLIEACQLLQARGYDFHCTLIGDGPEHDALTAQIDAAGLEHVITLAGPQPQEQLIETLKGATAVVLPCIVSKSGDRDGLPTVLLEAMAMGLPTVSTRVAGVPEIIDHGKTGLLAAANDAGDLADCLASLLDDPALCARMGAAARSKAEERFDLGKNVAQLAEWFADSASSSLHNEEQKDAYRLRHG